MARGGRRNAAGAEVDCEAVGAGCTLAVADWMKIGVAATRFKGIGPCVQVTFDKFTLWTNGYFFDPEKLNAEPSLMTGLSVSY